MLYTKYYYGLLTQAITDDIALIKTLGCIPYTQFDFNRHTYSHAKKDIGVQRPLADLISESVRMRLYADSCMHGSNKYRGMCNHRWYDE